MAKRHKPEEIITKLRQVDLLVSQGSSVPNERPSDRVDSRARADAEHVECIKAQAKADNVFNVHGKRASMPQVGESPLNYRVRMAGELRRFSPAHDGIDLVAIANSDAKGFGVIEDRIYADVLKFGYMLFVEIFRNFPSNL